MQMDIFDFSKEILPMYSNSTEFERLIEIIDALSRTHDRFSADDLYETSHGWTPNTVGAAFKAAETRGIIMLTGERAISRRRSNHGREIKIWARNPKAIEKDDRKV